MSLNPISPRLRAIKHNAISASKVSLSVPAGDVLHVSDVVADQLVAAAGEFQEVTEDEPVVEQTTAAPGEVRSVKRPAKKSAAKPKS